MGAPQAQGGLLRVLGSALGVGQDERTRGLLRKVRVQSCSRHTWVRAVVAETPPSSRPPCPFVT